MKKVNVKIDGKMWEMVAVSYGEWDDDLDADYALYERTYFEDMPQTVAALVAAGVDIEEIQMIGQRIIE